MLAKPVFDMVAVLASGARVATGTGGSVRLPALVNGAAFTLDVTAAATAVGDLLDVFIQTKLDGVNWVDVVHFTQCLGNGGALRYINKVSAQLATAEFEVGTALGAAAKRNLMGDEWRARWTITDTGAASFTFSVSACPM